MQELLDQIDAGNQPPIIAITGPSGVGRTMLLAKLRDALDGRGVRTVALRFSPDSRTVPIYLPDRVSDRRGSHWPVFGPATAPMVARLFAAENSVVLIDDAQWIDSASMAAFEQFARRAGRNGVRCVCAVRMPAAGSTAGPEALQRLRREGLVRTFRLGGLPEAEVTEHVASLLQHEPDPDLVAYLLGCSRGIPSALWDTLDALRDTNAIGFVAGRAHLIRHDEPAQYRRITAAVLELGPDAWEAAKAAAVLHPLGSAMPQLLAEALACTETEVMDRLRLLQDAGVLHRGRRGQVWRFPVPSTVTALIDSLGPYERRHLAKIAVTALWAGTAHCADTGYLADQIVGAGRLIDPRRARSHLLAQGRKQLADQPRTAARWLGAAADLAKDTTQYARISIEQAIACYLAGAADECSQTVHRIIEYCPDQLSAQATRTLQLLLVLSQYGTGDLELVRQAAEGRWRPTTEPGPDPVTQALALALLDRWGEAGDLLATTTELWHTEEVSELVGNCLLSVAEYWRGRTARFEHALPDRNGPASRTADLHRPRLADAHVTALLATGDLDSIDKLLIDERAVEERLNLSSQAMLAALRGNAAISVEYGQRCLAAGTVLEGDPGRAPMLDIVTNVLASQGRLAKARELLNIGRAANPILGHLLDGAEGRIEHALGNLDQAAAKVNSALDTAAANGLLVGTDLCWSQLAELAVANGDHQQAVHSLHEIDRAAKAMPTGRATMHALLVRATVHGDRAAATASLQLAQERGQPFELATLIARLVRTGVGDPSLLPQAYHLLGELGALLDRAWLRNLMHEHNVPVPDRKKTVAEYERLLGFLVAEGLSNKQLARVLRTSSKSVEGRLSRLFTRTGMRSRIELAQALLGSRS